MTCEGSVHAPYGGEGEADGGGAGGNGVGAGGGTGGMRSHGVLDQIW